MNAVNNITDGLLYLVATPIGNLSDMSQRAIDTLNEVDLIACEDTRTSGNLLKHFGIKAKTTSYHQHNEHKKTPELVQLMLGGTKIALISDAGMPAISDPGFLLVRAAHVASIPVIPIPGPVAGIALLAASGLPSDRFSFEGFLPQKKGRKTKLEALVEEDRTMIFYESPYRIVKLIEECKNTFGETRLACIGRELTKKFEEIKRDTLSNLLEDFSSRASIKGEFVLIVAGKSYSEDID
jgi:16S rRNA (cytidine1402-2'-O)-methyltransferase